MPLLIILCLCGLPVLIAGFMSPNPPELMADRIQAKVKEGK